MKMHGTCRCAVLGLVLFWLLLMPHFAQAQDEETFEQQIHALEKSFGGRMGIMAKNLRTGDTLAVAADEKFPTASAIKVPIMVEYFYQVTAGRLSPTQKVVLADSNKWGGSGLMQYFKGTTEQQLADAVMMMITISDNTATNLVIDALGETHAARLAAVNDRMTALGLKNTRLLNKLMSWKTKTDFPESIRYGIGVSTPADMVLLLEKMWHRALVDSAACNAMIGIMQDQFYDSMIPRFLPFGSTPGLHVAHKTGGVTAVRVDIGLVFSEKADFAIAIFCDRVQDWRGSGDNLAELAAAKAARLVWNYFTGDSGMVCPYVTGVDWNPFPGGEWARVFLHNSLYPHPSRNDGYTGQGKFFAKDPHYSDSSAVVVIPDGFHEVNNAIDLIVHFHGWYNDDLGVLEQLKMPQQLIASKKNAILVLAQGPWRAADSGGGKMEDDNGLRRFVEEILQILQLERRIEHTNIGRVIVTAHSGGYRPAIMAVATGGLQDHIDEVFLFDAFYAQTEALFPWLRQAKKHKLRSIYTEHLAGEHQQFIGELQKVGLSYSTTFNRKTQIVLSPTEVCHNCVIDSTFQLWLTGSGLSDR